MSDKVVGAVEDLQMLQEGYLSSIDQTLLEILKVLKRIERNME